uniref:Uncharacterized protein n=1 Tax=Rhizophora mucronata TaxID=61149 RepID=A0A2P2QFF7_RHIMU
MHLQPKLARHINTRNAPINQPKFFSGKQIINASVLANHI